jgi:hypothetical protein
MPDGTKIELALLIIVVCLCVCTFLVVFDMGRVTKRNKKTYPLFAKASRVAEIGVQQPSLAHAAITWLANIELS